jgi:hypothetical protein
MEREQHWRLQRAVNPPPYGILGSTPRRSTKSLPRPKERRQAF